MVVGLDGLEKLLVTISPDTMKETAYVCRGYQNTGTFSKGRLVEIYAPLGGGASYTLDHLRNTAEANNYEPKVYTRAPQLPPLRTEGSLFKPKPI